ncbi:protein HEAT INTOLERANT 4-like [Wolffia australiana]
MGRAKTSTRKRKAESSAPKDDEGGSKSPGEVSKGSTKASPRVKRARTLARKETREQEYFPEKRNLEDLWQAAFPVGTEWHNLDALNEVQWKFTNLEDAFEEGGELHGKRVYLFGCTEPQLLVINNEQKVACIPVVVAVVSPFPPSDKVGIKSIQRVEEEIIPMKTMKLAWVPYIPLEGRQSQVDRFKTQIFTMGCTQRRSALKHLKEERIKQYEYCLPYFYNPLNADEDEEDTVVPIMYPFEPPIVRDFDYDLDELEEFVTGLITDEVLPEDQKDAFKQFVKEQVRERKKSQREAREARWKAIEDMDEEKKSAFQSMKFYKFYPVQTPTTPDISQVKSPFINRYYGRAHAVF